MQIVWNDLRFSLRMLAKNPGFALTAVLTLALGIGANTAIFSVINSTLLSRLPYKDASRLVVVWESNPHRASAHNVISPANFFDWQEQNKVFDQMGVFFDWHVNLTSDAEPEEVLIQYVSANFFSLLGAHPAMGRTFTAEDGQQGHDQVVILSDGLWRRRFGADPHIVGKQIHVDGSPMTIVGVMPRGFQFYVKSGSLMRSKAEMWNPFAFTQNSRKRMGRYLMALGRLKPGVTLQHAQSEMDAIAMHLAMQYPDFDKGWGISLAPLRQELTREIRAPILILFGAVGLVLLIACANVANLLLARAAVRQKEIAIRIAMGAGRWQVFRQMLTENVLLAVIGGTLGVFLAMWGVDLLLAISPKEVVDVFAIHVDLRILAFTAGISLIAGIVFGLAPAFHALRWEIGESLKEGGRGSSHGARGHRLRNAFVVAEVSLALVLLAGSGLLIRSFARLAAVDPGFQPKNLLTFKVSLPGSKYGKDQSRAVFFAQLLERIRALPGVQSASANSFLPFTGLGAATGFTISGRPNPAAGEKPTTDVRVVAPDYFRTMGIPLLKGRLFTEREASTESHVVIVNQALVNRSFPEENPIGKKITIEMKQVNVPCEIVGVVGDVKHDGLDIAPHATSYWPYPELTYNFMTVVVRTTDDPVALIPAVRAEVLRMDKDEPISDIATMEQRLSVSLARARFSMLLMTIFSGVAVLLATIGIYGVISYSVAQRTSEIGIRMTLGAQRADVSRLVLTEGIKLSSAGIAFGTAAAAALTRVLQGLLFEVKAADPLTFAGVAIFLAAVSLFACYLPARRATRVDPLVALRHE